MAAFGLLKWDKPICAETLGQLQEADVPAFRVKPS